MDERRGHHAAAFAFPALLRSRFGDRGREFFVVVVSWRWSPRPAPAVRGRRLKLLVKAASSAAGVLLAIAFLEASLRVFVTPAELPPPRIMSDSLGAAAVA